MTYLIIIALVLAIFLFSRKNKINPQDGDSISRQQEAVPPAKLLDLDTTTVADRQRAYHHGYRTQLRYDILQRQAELDGDTATLEPEPTNPYDQNAIKIVTREGHRVGYVPKDQTQCVRDFSTFPCRCYCYIGTNDGFYFTDCYIKRNDQ